MLERNAAERAVRKLLAQELTVEESEIVPNASIKDDLGADSLAQVELVMVLEENFGIEDIPDEEADKLRIVQDVIDYVVEHGTKIPEF